MEKVQIKAMDVLEEAWDIAKQKGIMVAVVIAVITAVSYGVSSIFGGTSTLVLQKAIESENPMLVMPALSESMSASLISSLLQYILAIGVVNMTMGIISGKYKEATLEAYNLPLNVYVKYVVTCVVVGIIEALDLCAVCCQVSTSVLA